MKAVLLTFAGAAAGGALGYLAFSWVLGQGFYALVLPGALLGLGAGLAPNRSVAVAVVCGLAALAIGVVTEYHFRPFIADERFSYFVAHLHDLTPVTLLMIAAGGVIGFWVPYGKAARGL